MELIKPPPTLRKLIYDLDTIAKIHVGDQLSTTTNEYLNIEQNSVLGLINRKLTGDTRYRGIDFIDLTITAAVDFLYAYMESKYLDMAVISNTSAVRDRLSWINVLCHKIFAAISGVSNYAKTYAEDRKIVSDADEIMRKCSVIVQESRKFTELRADYIKN